MRPLAIKSPLMLAALVALAIGAASSPALAKHGRSRGCDDNGVRISVSFGSLGYSHGHRSYSHRTYSHRNFGHFRSYDNCYRPTYRSYRSHRHVYRASQHVHGRHSRFDRHDRHDRGHRGHGHSHRGRGRR